MPLAVLGAILPAFIINFISFVNDTCPLWVYSSKTQEVPDANPSFPLTSIEFNEMAARQSDIRNKIIAPAFKKIGTIDQ